jgi:hypothetical protein
MEDLDPNEMVRLCLGVDEVKRVNLWRVNLCSVTEEGGAEDRINRNQWCGTNCKLYEDTFVFVSLTTISELVCVGFHKCELNVYRTGVRMRNYQSWLWSRGGMGSCHQLGRET